jgi:pimeloyl-ACP methyl ester carboxylesterase
VIPGSAFNHLVLQRPAPPSAAAGELLRVYLEGDGRPFVTPGRIALDPTPRRPVALQLMLQDPGPAVYLGRPCYFGIHSAACAPRYWTVARYAPEVVDSLVNAINATRGSANVVIIGHSGGGTLAVLVAARLDAVRHVVTMGANLDTDAWTRLHGYTPLTQSLNPSRTSLPRALRQFHAFGAADANVPPQSIGAFADANPNATLCVLPRCGHEDCWQSRWQRFLTNLHTESDKDLCRALRSR